MLRLPARLTKMDLLQAMVMMWALLVLTAAEHHCDPETQYPSPDSEECCKMCEPGTYMRKTLNNCQQPECEPCKETEYQDKYTKEPKCILHPYCDQNLNFQAPVNIRTKKGICQCKEGFHCATAACMTCVPHKTCGPGYWAQTKGNHTHDTVCQACPKGTFSSESSWNGVCKEWTQCRDGQRQIQPGTETSDNICVGTSRTHAIVISIVVGVIILIVISGLVFWLFKVKRGNAKGSLKGCVESCVGGEHEPLAEPKLVTNPTGEEESMMPEPMSSQEEGFGRTPEENEDELTSQETSGDVLLTDKGNYVTQENGKTEILSRQESQTQTYSA